MIAEEAKKKQILMSLQRECSRREHCRSEVYAKALKALDNDIDAASEITDSLEADRYVDEKRYCAAFVSDKAGLVGWGPLKIRMALSAKGIRSEIIEDALSCMDSGRAMEKLMKMLQTRWKALAGDSQGKLKLIRYALSRGYDYDTVREAVDRTLMDLEATSKK